MKKLVLIILLVTVSACNESDETTVLLDELSEKEMEDLQFLKEEEKLARDVYLFSYDLYQQNIFSSISNSEQSHMNAVTVIMDKYNVEDLSLNERGKFSNETLQNLYYDLTEFSSESNGNALIVGAKIEDLDINDLNNFISNTNHQDLEWMYSKLNCGSKNHLRAFTYSLENVSIQYVPQYISAELYNDILSTNKAQCN